ncbi:hypothetical protein QBC35DRAFT_504049 [Podospora australis]|uniref:Uncharacterized protein n=1 Tax=Podospora australis TaxID=1536484 RepID=A0AAN6WS29_9PEZI|nr:hypothetical protein QBC35DRAFT_504049 [Podospora australis]
MVVSGALAVRWIRDYLVQQPSSSSSSSFAVTKAENVHHGVGVATEQQTKKVGMTRKGAKSLPEESDSTTTTSYPNSASRCTTDNDGNDLLHLIPSLIHHGREHTVFRQEFAFYAAPRGKPLSLLTPPLSSDSPRRELLQCKLGDLCRRLAGLLSPTGRFGPLAAVQTTIANPRQPNIGSGGLFETGGAGTWSVAFQSMLEGILRDGEDMAVVLSYATIRRHFRRLGYLLDEVTTARLVVLDAADESNILVTMDSQDDDAGESKIIVVGLSDWSSCVFGDPLLATAFSDPLQLPHPPSAAFLRGFNHTVSETEPGYPAGLNRAIIEDVDKAPIRLLLYQVYHSVTRIVREFYRPRGDNSASELEARRALNLALTKLAEVSDDDVRKKERHPRPSGEMSPAKRIKTLEHGNPE